MNRFSSGPSAGGWGSDIRAQILQMLTTRCRYLNFPASIGEVSPQDVVAINDAPHFVTGFAPSPNFHGQRYEDTRIFFAKLYSNSDESAKKKVCKERTELVQERSLIRFL